MLHMIEVRNDELRKLTWQVKERGITHSVMISLIGAEDSCTISTTPADGMCAERSLQAG